MKISKLAIGVALCGALSAGAVWAQGLHQPETVKAAAYEYNSYRYVAEDDASEESSGDAAATTGCCEPACCDPACCEQPDCEPSCCESSCGECQSGCGLGDPWTLPQPCLLQNHGIVVGGWLSAGIFGNAHGATSNGPLGFNDVGDGFTLNQLWIFADKATDTGGYGVDWGGRIDYVFGVDGPDTQAFGDGGWDSGWNTGRDYGSAIPQLYGEVAFNNLTIKGGRFYTIIGWEVVQAPDNFFYSHASTMYYAEPFTHTGFLASYNVNDAVTVHGGWTAGWDSGWENLNDASTFLGGISLTLSDNASLAWACSAGTQGDAGGVIRGDVYMNSFVFEYGLSDNLTYIFQHDLGAVSGLGAVPAQWYGINQYIQYQLNERWAAGMRLEWFRDDDGQRVVVNNAGTGNAGDYYGVTWGLNYRPHANVVVRPELRYDWYNGNFASGAQPFNDGADDEQFSGGFDFIVTF